MKENYADVKYQWAEMPAGPAGKATLGFTVAYSMGVDSKNKDASWVLISYLTGPEGMNTWTEGGMANPSRNDLQGGEGKEILIQGADYAKPWAFVPGFSKVNDAFNNAFTAAVQGDGSAEDIAHGDEGRDRRAASKRVRPSHGRGRSPTPPARLDGRSDDRRSRAAPAPGAACRRSTARRRWPGYALIAVPIVLFVLLQIGQVFYAGYISLFDWGLRGPQVVPGHRELQKVLADPLFYKAVTNTLYYTVLVVPLQMVIGLFLAVIVNQKIRGQTFFRAAFYFPAIASSAAITVLFLFLARAERAVQRRTRGTRLQPTVPGTRVRCQPGLVR